MPSRAVPCCSARRPSGAARLVGRVGSRLDLSYPEESQFLRLTEPIEWEKCNEVLSLRDFSGSDYQCIRSSYASVCRRRWCRRTLCRRGWNIKSMEAKARSTAAGLRSRECLAKITKAAGTHHKLAFQAARVRRGPRAPASGPNWKAQRLEESSSTRCHWKAGLDS